MRRSNSYIWRSGESRRGRDGARLAVGVLLGLFNGQMHVDGGLNLEGQAVDGVQAALTAPRFVYGRSLDGQPNTDLKVECRFDPALVERPGGLGHTVEQVAAFDSLMGHAGALVRRPDGMIEGGADPRADGVAAGW